jgi:phage-related protein
MAGLGTAVSVGGKAIKAMKDSQVLASDATKIWSGTQAVLNLVMDANPIMIVVLAVAAITAAIILAYTHCQTFRDVVKDMGKIAVDIFNGIKTVAMDVFHWISNNWPLLVGVLFGPFGLAVAIIATHINTVKGIVTGLISHITTAFSTVLGIITAPFSQAAAGISAAFSTAITFVQGIPGDITTALGDVTNLLYNAGKTIIDSLGRGIKDAFDAVKNFVGGIGSKIASLKGPLDYDRQLLVPAGSAIMQGLGRGLTQGFGRFVAPTLAETTRALSAAGGSSAPGSITTTTPVGGVKGRGGPAVVIQNVTVAAPMDVDSFMRRVSWEARRTGV